MPFQLKAGKAWAALDVCLANGETFDIVILGNLRWELVRCWTVLNSHADPAYSRYRLMEAKAL
ncbi:MAG: hypothetical protein WBX25_16060 [Rhodomicrobium sp.]